MSDTGLHALRHATAQSIVGSHLRRVFIPAQAARDLQKQVHNRASRTALTIALAAETDPVYLFTDDRDRIVSELTAPTPEALRKVGAL